LTTPELAAVLLLYPDNTFDNLQQILQLVYMRIVLHFKDKGGEEFFVVKNKTPKFKGKEREAVKQ
jgi:hypothetical protein